MTEDEMFGKYAKQCLHFLRNTLLPYEKEWTSIACGCNIIKWKNN